jgi:hypothetical protein
MTNPFPKFTLFALCVTNVARSRGSASQLIQLGFPFAGTAAMAPFSGDDPGP